jgi:hypothetical protein
MQIPAILDEQFPVTAAEVTGADAVYIGVVEQIVRRFISSRGGDPLNIEILNSADVQRVKAGLFSVYPAFQRLYSDLFIKHVGEEHAPAVLAELRREPLQRYLYARSAMNGELNRGLADLRDRMSEMEP